MKNCSFENCGKEINDAIPFKCSYCGKIFCREHRLPENHQCSLDHAPSKRKHTYFDRRSKWNKNKQIYSKNHAKFLTRNKWKIVFIIVCLSIIIGILDIRFLIFGPYGTTQLKESIQINYYNNMEQQTVILDQFRERCNINFSANQLVALYVFDNDNYQKFLFHLDNGYGPDYTSMEHVDFSLNGQLSITQWKIDPNTAEVNTFHLVFIGPIYTNTNMNLTLTYPSHID